MQNNIDPNVDKNNIYNETLETAAEYIKKLIAGIKKYIEYMNADKIAESGDLLISIIEGLEWEVNALALIKVNVDIKIDTNEINPIFTSLISAIENKDYVLVTDLFQFEILPTMEKWESLLNNK